MSMLDDILLAWRQGGETGIKRQQDLEAAIERARVLGPLETEQAVARERAMGPVRTEQAVAHERALAPVRNEALANQYRALWPVLFGQKQEEQEAEAERSIAKDYGTEAGQAYRESRKPAYQGLPSYPLGPDTPPPPQWGGTAGLKLKASPEYQAKQMLSQIMGGGMQEDLPTLKRQRDALRILPLPTAQSLADDIQKRIDVLEAAPGKAAKEAREVEAHTGRMQNYARLEQEGKSREELRRERIQNMRERRKRLEEAASGKKPFTSRELMTDRSGLISQRQAIENRWDIEDPEKEALLRDVDEEIAFVNRQLKEARRREQATPTPGPVPAAPGSTPGSAMQLTPAQEAAVKAAPEGHIFALGGKRYIKRGGQLVPAQP